MAKIDAHQHFWQYNPVRDAWISEEMEVIRRDFMPKDLEEHLREHQIDGTVAVQADQSEDENSFLAGLAKEHSFIKGVVGWVDLQAADVEDRLSYYHTLPIMKGFRHVLQSEEDRAFMLRPAFMQGIGKLQKFGFTYDILIYADQLKFARQLVSAFPNQPFVLNHIAKPAIKAGKVEEWKKDIQALAQHENVWCKISGMVTEADWERWKYDDFVPYLDVVTDAFGVRRLMFGSDWPVCRLAGEYKSTIGIVEKYFSHFTENEQALFWGENAVKFYNLTS